MNKLAKLKAMSRDERRLIFQAWVLLPVTALFLRGVGFRRTQRLLILISGKSSAPALSPERAKVFADRTARLISSASLYSPVAVKCLPRALVLWWLLRRSGIDSELRIGVRKQQEKFEAHAWVELFGLALNGQVDDGERFIPFEASIWPPEVRLP